MSVDTLSLARERKAAEIPAVQAEAIAAAIGRSNAESMTSAATKADLAQLAASTKADIAQVVTKVEQVRSQLTTWFAATNLTLAAIVVAVVKL